MRETLLKQLARERHLTTLRKFNQVYRRTARELQLGEREVSPRQFERWLAGAVKTAPQPEAREVLEAMFGQPTHRLFDVVQSEPAPESTVIDLSELPATTAWSPPRTSDADRSSPESLYQLMMSAADESRESAREAEAAIGRPTMESLESEVIGLSRTYLTQPPTTLLPKVVEVRRQLHARLEETSRPDQLRQLRFLAGVATALLTEICIDLGQHRMAYEHARSAWAHADAIGHTGLAVWARGMQASSSYWADLPNDAVVAISRAAEHHPTGVSAARMHSIEARTWSHVGNVQGTMSAVRAAVESRASANDRDDLHDGIGGVFFWDEAREQRCHSSAYLQLIKVRQDELQPGLVAQLTAQILQHTQRALSVSQAAPPSHRSLPVEATIGLDMATAFLLLGDLDSARETLWPVLELAADLRTHPVLYRLRGLHGQLALVQESRAKTELVAAVTEFAAGSTVRALPAGS
ncbi:hypothetical protein [Nonomuraea glycinis]|uniref:hypothetical protein n=1 Tax=Nonomuraea glycinis TaxID=2047744 RepID=UPI0033A2B2FB